MIGLFDSGLGGLTVYRALVERFPHQRFVYLGDHANAPYGNRPSEQIVELTKAGVSQLFDRGARLVLLACNTATAVAARTLQRDWLPGSQYSDCKILGIIAPTVEAATQTPWAVTTPQYPQKYTTDTIAVFGTTRTIASGVYREEIAKRCPLVTVVQQACPSLVDSIEHGTDANSTLMLVESYVEAMMTAAQGRPPERAILGCTHFPLIEPLFRKALPAATRLLSQPEIVANSLEDYLNRHPLFAQNAKSPHAGALDARHTVMTSGAVSVVAATLDRFWPAAWPNKPRFESAFLTTDSCHI